MIYLDNNASTQLAPEARAAMEDALGAYGNPSSVHQVGQDARRRLEEARGEIAALIGSRGDEIVLTSGGTESNALAIFGACAGKTGRVVISAVEHPSVRECAARLASTGRFEVVAVSPDSDGTLDTIRVLEAVVPGTVLVSVMAANNEYGGVFPVRELGEEVRRRGSLFHTDAVQAAGRMPLDVTDWGVDLLSLSAHKLHGPRGAGALYVRRGVSIESHTPGGGQERRLRAGTENPVAAAGFAAAARLAAARLPEAARVSALRDRLEAGLTGRIPGARVVGGGGPRLGNTSAVAFAGVSGETLLIRLDLEGVAVSVGSACSSGTLAPSPAIRALGIPESEARGVVRFSLSRLTTDAEVSRVLDLMPGVVQDVRRASVRAEALALPAASGRRT